MEKLPGLDYGSSLADLLRDYLDYLDHLGFSTVMEAYNLRHIDRFLLRHGVSCPEQLEVRLLARFVHEHQGRVKAHTLRLWRQTFHKLCRYLVRRGWIAVNPVASFPIPKPQPYRPHVFTPQELHLFFTFLNEQVRRASNPHTRFRALSRYTLYHLLYACGLRVSEAIALTTRYYSPAHATLYIECSKFHKDRLIPIGQKVCSNLDHLLTKRQEIFGSPREPHLFLLLPEARPYSRHWVSTYFRRVLQRLGVYHGEQYHRGFYHGTPHLHELRRAFAVHRLMRWYREQVDVDAKLPLLATYMGHGYFGHTKTYLTLTQQLLSEAGRRFARRFDRLDWLADDSEFQ